ncbi:MAG: DUF6477 family protein [Pseudomonadota bacterium]
MSLTLRRPRLLARAARAGATLYNRDRDLGRLVPKAAYKTGRKNLMAALTSAEASCEAERTLGSATYSIQRHIGLLAALFAEAKTART